MRVENYTSQIGAFLEDDPTTKGGAHAILLDSAAALYKTDDIYYQFTDELGGWVYIVCAIYLALLSAVAIPLNLTFVLIFAATKKLQTPFNGLLLSLMLSQLGCCYGAPVAFVAALRGGWDLGQNMCIATGDSIIQSRMLMTLFGMATIGNLTAISIFRWVIVIFEGRISQLPLSIALITGSWVFAAIMTFPPLVGIGAFVPESNGISCSPGWTEPHHKVYAWYLFILGFTIPLVIIIYTSVGVVTKIKENMERYRSQTVRTKALKRERKIFHMIGLMIAAFLVSWTPYACIALARTLDLSEYISEYVALIPHQFAKSSTLWMPCTFFLMNSSFRRELPDVLPKLALFRAISTAINQDHSVKQQVDNKMARSVTQTLGLVKQADGSMVNPGNMNDSSDSSPESDSHSSVSAMKAMPSLDPLGASSPAKLTKQSSKKAPKLAAIKAKNDVSKSKGNDAFNKHKSSQHILTSMTSGYKSFSSDMLNELTDSYNYTIVEDEKVKSVYGTKQSPKESQILPRSPLARTTLANSKSVPLKMFQTLEVNTATVKSSKLSLKSDNITDKSIVTQAFDVDNNFEEKNKIIAENSNIESDKTLVNTELETADKAPICPPEDSVTESTASNTESKLSSTISLPDFSIKPTGKLPKPGSEYQLGGSDTVAEIQAESLGINMKNRQACLVDGGKTRNQSSQTHKKYQVTYV